MMVSAAGFEPTAPGFIPLRLSPPMLRDRGHRRSFVVWTVSSPWPGRTGRQALPVQSLHLHRPDRAVFGSGLARRKARAFPEFEQIHHNVSVYGAQF
ncbi:hypothetical protein C0V97_03005 [Asaia sp. W19]|nr:hypothetical protein C0V97_03005 [Asaia sp. W19]